MKTNQKDTGVLDFVPKFNLKTLFVVILFAIGIYFLIPKLIDVEQALHLILKVNKLYLGLALLAEISSYLSAAWILGIILSRLGYKIRFIDRFKIGSISAFAIHFFPIGSLGEGAIEYYFLRKKQVETGSILIMFLLRIIFTYAAFLIIFLTGLILVPTYPHLSFSPKLASFILFVAILAGVIYMIYLYRHKNKFLKVWQKFTGLINLFLGKSKKYFFGETKSEEIFEDLYKGIGMFGKKKRNSVMAIFATLLYWLGDVVCLYFVFLSFGFKIGWGVLIFGYGVSTLAGLVSTIPGGLGVVESSMGLIYSGLGIPTSLVLMSILVFRLFSFWIWIPIGLISYLTLRRDLRS